MFGMTPVHETFICLDFDFGSRSYEEEMDHLLKQFGPFEHDKSLSEESKKRIRVNISKCD